jgi:hypothetical protein
MTYYFMVAIPSDSEYNTPVGHSISGEQYTTGSARFTGKSEWLTSQSQLDLQYWLDDVESGNEHAPEPTELETETILFFESDVPYDLYEGQALVDTDGNAVIVQRVIDLPTEAYQTWMDILEEEE